MKLLLKYYSYVSLFVLLVSCFLFYFVDYFLFCHVLLSTSRLCLFSHLLSVYTWFSFVHSPPVFLFLCLPFVVWTFGLWTSSCLPRCPHLGPHHYANHNRNVIFQPFTFTQVWLLITFQSTCLNFPARFGRFTFICLTLIIL